MVDPSFLLLALLLLATQLKEECVMRLLTGDAPTMREYAFFHHLPVRPLRLPDVCCTCRANQSNSVTVGGDRANRDLGSPTFALFFIMTASLKLGFVCLAVESFLTVAHIKAHSAHETRTVHRSMSTT